MSDVRERVERGAAWLDEHEPGWELKIDLGELNLGDCRRCILGQVFGNYNFGLSMDRQLWTDATGHGFDRDRNENYAVLQTLADVIRDNEQAYAELQEAWTSLIKERLDRGIQIV